MRKRVQKWETKNSNYQNELLNLHKCLLKISKMLSFIDFRRVKLKHALEQEQVN
jgi:hypothetical protein